MKVYSEIFRTTIAEYFTYRLNFVLWRVRMVLNLLIVLFLWQSVFENHNLLFGYTQSQMLTYIIMSALVSSFVLTTKTTDIAGNILSGNIINNILKPISFFKYHLARDAADKSVNIGFAIFEIALIIILMKPPLILQTNIAAYIPFIVLLLSGILISFFVNMSLSFIGFWTTEIWAPRFIFYMIIFFLSGSYFPLDILPAPLYRVLLMTPFPYFYYLPSKAYLDPFSPLMPFFMVMSFFWIVVTYFMTRSLWNKGLRSFSFFGR